MEDKKLSKVFLYAHGGSGNHGCEALVRSTIKLLNSADVTLISTRPDEDIKYGIDHICTIIKETNENFKKISLDFAKAYLALKVKNNPRPMEKLRYKDAFDHIKKGDIALSIGGDNYCYADVDKYIMMHEMLKKRGAKTVLWGCSIEPEIVSKKHISHDLARYDLIIARESITFESVRKINSNSILLPDPAFFLEMEKTVMPEKFAVGNTVGINLSPMIIDCENQNGVVWQNYVSLIDFILTKTDMNIAFFPHVVWKENDDRIPLSLLYQKYKKTERVCLVEDQTCSKLKYLISKCRFFVGARTHSTIAAYSTLIPSIVLGYSVKSVGIASDLFTPRNNYVVVTQQLSDSGALTRRFITLLENESKINERLNNKMTIYNKKRSDYQEIVL